MSLADVPKNTRCVVKSIWHTEENLKYIKAGIAYGRELRILFHHPSDKPLLVEVELEDSSLITIPLSLAKEVFVEIA